MLPKMILTESRRHAFREIMMTSTPAGMIAAQRAMSSRPDSSSTLRALKPPALVVIDNAAHASNFDQPDAFNRAVTEFLGMRFRSK